MLDFSLTLADVVELLVVFLFFLVMLIRHWGSRDG